MKHRIYIAGPYSAPTLEGRERNTHRAAEATVAVMRKGHLAHCPHTATHLPDVIAKGAIGYEVWMELDFSIIRRWATGVLCFSPSPGANREVQLARELGLPVWYHVDEVPAVVKPVGDASVFGPMPAGAPA